MAAAIQTMPPCCSSRVPGKLESLHVCQRTSFRQCRSLFISRRATRRGLTKPLARVSRPTPKPGALLLQMPAHVDGSCTGTQVLLMWEGLELALHRRGGRRVYVHPPA